MMVLTKEQIEDMRTSLSKGAQPFTKDAIDSLCAMASGALVSESLADKSIGQIRHEINAREAEITRRPGS